MPPDTAPASSSVAKPVLASTGPVAPAHKSSSYEVFLVAVLAFLQFTVVLDFMILSPLGAILLKELNVAPARFGLVVSAYAFSAGASGLLAAGFADRFDRKRLLLFFYSGFVLGTLLCGMATSYRFLLIARMVTGLFGGVIGSVCMAIIADTFPLSARGRVMGFVQTAFAASQIMGLPLGLWMATHWSWHAPFLGIVAVSTVVGVIIVLRMRPMVGHLGAPRVNAFRHLLATLTRSDYLRAYATTSLLVTGGFMLMPFGSAFSVNNLGISLHELPLVYMVTGLSSIIAGPLVGRLSDSVGKFRMFCFGTALSAVMVLVFTHLGRTPLRLVILCNVLLFLGITSRMISASALISAVPPPADRGAFMSVNSSIQQLAGGVAAAVAGLIVVQTGDGPLRRYDVLGFVVTAAILGTAILLWRVARMIAGRAALQT